METIIKIELPLKRWPRHKESEKYLPRWRRWLMPILDWGGGAITQFGGNRINRVRHYAIFRWGFMTIRRNEYHDKTDAERAEEYLKKWSECERELRGLRLLQMGDENPDPAMRKLLRDSLGVDLDEGRIL